MSNIPIKEVAPRSSRQPKLLVDELLEAHDDNWAQLMTTRAASHRTRALEPVGTYAFMYEASDIHPEMTIGEFRSQRSGNRHKRGLHARLRRLVSRGHGDLR
jgi:hypothetical protein